MAPCNRNRRRIPPPVGSTGTRSRRRTQRSQLSNHVGTEGVGGGGEDAAGEVELSAEITELPIEFLQLRVLIWKEAEYFIGQCLETGSIATADDFHTLRNMMYSLLAHEHYYNLHGEGSLRNLFDTPAPLEIWLKYHHNGTRETYSVVSSSSGL